MIDTDASDLIRFAKTWTSLGWAITDQIERLVDDPDCGSCWNEGTEQGVNPTAIEMAYDRLRGMNADLDEILSEFLESIA